MASVLVPAGIIRLSLTSGASLLNAMSTPVSLSPCANLTCGYCACSSSVKRQPMA